MVFLVKKILSSFLMPLPIGLLIGIIGLYFIYTNRIKKAKIFITISLLWIFTISYLPFAYMLISPLENMTKELSNIPNHVKYMIILGGDFEHRGWEILKLHNKNKNIKIITSGYKADYSIAEATRTANILTSLGIDKKYIIQHTKPKDTIEEAIKIKSILKKEPFILITSAYHMPRALKIFQQEGLNPVPAPTDYKIKIKNIFLSMPSGKALKITEIAWHEYLGILWLKLKKLFKH